MSRLFELAEAASITQLLLRTLALVCGWGALALAAGGGEWGWQWPITVVGVGFLAWATVRPDAEAGLGLCCTVVLNATAGHPTLATCAVIGLTLLAAHVLWSACAMVPAHGTLRPRLLGWMALAAVGLAAASLVVDLAIANLPRLDGRLGLVVLSVTVISLTAVAIVFLADRSGLTWRRQRDKRG